MSAAVKLQDNSKGGGRDLRFTLLARAVQRGDVSAIQKTIAEGADVNGTSLVGTSLLMRAAAFGQLEVVRNLIEQGASIDSQRIDGFNALLFAVFFGHEDVVTELISRGADLKAQSRSGTSAQKWASARGFTRILDLLIDAEARQAKFSGEAKDKALRPVVATSVTSDVVESEIGIVAAESKLNEPANEIQITSESGESAQQTKAAPAVETSHVPPSTAQSSPQKPNVAVTNRNVVSNPVKGSQTFRPTSPSFDTDYARRENELIEAAATPRCLAQADSKHVSGYSPVSTLFDRLGAGWKYGLASVVAGAVALGVFGALRFELGRIRTPLTTQEKSAAPPVTSTFEPSSSLPATQPKPAETQPSVANEAPQQIAPSQATTPASSTDVGFDPKPLQENVITQHSREAVRTIPRNFRRVKSNGDVRITSESGVNTNAPAAPITVVTKKPAVGSSMTTDAPAQPVSPLEGSSTKKKVIQWP